MNCECLWNSSSDMLHRKEKDLFSENRIHWSSSVNSFEPEDKKAPQFELKVKKQNKLMKENFKKSATSNDISANSLQESKQDGNVLVSVPVMQKNTPGLELRSMRCRQRCAPFSAGAYGSRSHTLAADRQPPGTTSSSVLFLCHRHCRLISSGFCWSTLHSASLSPPPSQILLLLHLI